MKKWLLFVMMLCSAGPMLAMKPSPAFGYGGRVKTFEEPANTTTTTTTIVRQQVPLLLQALRRLHVPRRVQFPRVFGAKHRI